MFFKAQTYCVHTSPSLLNDWFKFGSIFHLTKHMDLDFYVSQFYSMWKNNSEVCIPVLRARRINIRIQKA